MALVTAPKLERSYSAPDLTTPLKETTQYKETRAMLDVLERQREQDVPNRQQIALEELNRIMKAEKLASHEEAFALLKQREPEKAFRVWCMGMDKSLPDDLSEEPVKTYLLLKEFNREKPDPEELSALRKIEARQVLQKAAAAIAHSKETSAIFKKAIACLINHASPAA